MIKSNKIIVEFEIDTNEEKIVEISKIIPQDFLLGTHFLKINSCCGNFNVPFNIRGISELIFNGLILLPSFPKENDNVSFSGEFLNTSLETKSLNLILKKYINTILISTTNISENILVGYDNRFILNESISNISKSDYKWTLEGDFESIIEFSIKENINYLVNSFHSSNTTYSVGEKAVFSLALKNSGNASGTTNIKLKSLLYNDISLDSTLSIDETKVLSIESEVLIEGNNQIFDLYVDDVKVDSISINSIIVQPIDSILLTTLPYGGATRGTNIHMFTIEFTESSIIDALEIFLSTNINNNSDKFVLDIIDGDMNGVVNLADLTSSLIDDPSITILQRKTNIVGASNLNVKIIFNSTISVISGRKITFAIYKEGFLSTSPTSFHYNLGSVSNIQEHMVQSYGSKIIISNTLTGVHALNLYKI